MRKEKLFKIVLVMVITIALLGVSGNVFAADDTYLDITGPITGTDINTNTDPTPDTTPEPTPEVKPETNNQQNDYNTNLPETGLAENTMLVVAVVMLTGIAIFAYKKVNEYKNI